MAHCVSTRQAARSVQLPVLAAPRTHWHHGALPSRATGAACVTHARRAVIVRAVENKPGGSVLDAPTLPGMEKSLDSTRQRPPIYNVMLHNDNYNRREYVVKVLLKVIKGMTVDDAVVAMNEAHESGVAMVVTCPQEDAERYCEGLRLNGLTSSIEPGRK